MAHLFSYLVALLTLLIVNVALMAVVLALLRPQIRRSESRARGAGFVAGLLGTFVPVWLYAALAERTGLDLSYLMLILAGVLIILHDLRRLAQARPRTSGLEAVQGEEVDIGAIGHVEYLAMEQATLPGHVFGLLFGLGFFLGGAPLI
jgi:hypothetical protein